LGGRLAVKDMLVFGHAGCLATGKVADCPPHAFASQLGKWCSFLALFVSSLCIVFTEVP
jgi:hypothetical protein